MYADICKITRYFQCFRFGTTASICAQTCSAGQFSFARCSAQKSISCSLLVYRNSPSAEHHFCPSSYLKHRRFSSAACPGDPPGSSSISCICVIRQNRKKRCSPTIGSCTAFVSRLPSGRRIARRFWVISLKKLGRFIAKPLGMLLP